MTNWISCKERLPKEIGRYLLTDGEYVDIYYFIGSSYASPEGDWERNSGYDTIVFPTHWAEIPEAPK
jgi:hypothetical protein